MSEGWYGVPFTDNLNRTRTYVDTVRRTLRRERIQLPLEGGDPAFAPTGLGAPLKLLTRPVQDPLPIYLGAMAPRAVRQVGAIADGWLAFLLDPNDADATLAPLREGLAAAGRSPADVDVAPVLPVAVDEDLEAARDAVRPWLAFYLGAMDATAKNFYVEAAERLGHGAAARAVQAQWVGGDRAASAAAVTVGLIDAMALATTPRALDDRLAAYERVGVTTLLAVPCGEDRTKVVRAIAAATATR